MKSKLIIGLATLLALLCLSCAALAADSPLNISMNLSQTRFTEPGPVTVGIQISNTSDKDLPGPVTLYYPNDRQVEEFGSPILAGGAVKTWSGVWNVTEDQLINGKITFSIKYSMYNDAGELITKRAYFNKPITFDGAVTSVEINRVITPTTAEQGQKVTITYEVVNTGNTNVTDISIRENDSISKTQGTIGAVNAGEKKSYTFTATMGTKNLTSQATIKYKVGNKSFTAKKDAFTIKHGQVNLKATLASDRKGAVAGEQAVLTITLKNTGKVAYSDITVTERTLGELFSGQTLAAGESKTLEHTITVDATRDYIVDVSAVDSSGVAVTTATSALTVSALTQADVIVLSVEAEADRDTVYTLPGTVRFHVRVTNNGTAAVSNVNVYATNVRLYSFPSIEAGETRDFVRDIGISMAGQYQFEARAVDKLDQTQRFTSNILRIGYTAPTPVPTEAPIITPPVPSYEPVPTGDGLPDYVDMAQQTLDIVFWVFGGLAALSGILLVFGLIRRAKKNRRYNTSENYMEMELSEVTDYAAKARKGQRRMVSSETETADDPVDLEAKEPSETPAESKEDKDESGETGKRRR